MLKLLIKRRRLRLRKILKRKAIAKLRKITHTV